IDEIDKICKKGEHSGGDLKRERGESDFLAGIGGSTVNTKNGMGKNEQNFFFFFV
ncbi:AAA family ATPase, partial [Glaesserella parasuis]|nr:AAA family ATPase [Glaesserella parasuis]